MMSRLRPKDSAGRVESVVRVIRAATASGSVTCSAGTTKIFKERILKEDLSTAKISFSFFSPT